MSGIGTGSVVFIGGGYGRRLGTAVNDFYWYLYGEWSFLYTYTYLKTLLLGVLLFGEAFFHLFVICNNIQMSLHPETQKNMKRNEQ
jgi:hypothetical protein